MAGLIEGGKTLMAEVDRTKLPLIAAGVAFYGLLALFPGIGALMALGGLVADPAQVAETLAALGKVLPADAAEIVTTQAQQVAGSSGDDLGLVAIVGVLITIYSASKGMQALIDGLNLMNDREDDRGFVRQTLLKLGLTVGLLFGVLLCIAVAVVVPLALEWVPLARDTEWLVTAARWPVLLVIAACGIALTYRIGPAGRRMSWRAIVPGAALACVMWLAGTGAFAIYVRMFGSYQETFGALGGVVILLMWLWVSASIVLFGALIARMRRKEPAPAD